MYQPGETYDDIREAVGKLCAEFPASYWRALDREMAYPAAFVQALTEAGWLGALIPERFWWIRPAALRSCGYFGRNPPVGGQCGRVSCADVYHGNPVAAWLRGAKDPVPAKDRGRDPTVAGLWCNRAQLRYRYRRIAHHRQARWVPIMSSTGRKFGPAEQSIPTSCCFWRARHRWKRG